MPNTRKNSADKADPKLPHERDESPGDAADTPRSEGRKAYEDARKGVPDTDRGPVVDETYRRLRDKKP